MGIDTRLEDFSRSVSPRKHFLAGRLPGLHPIVERSHGNSTSRRGFYFNCRIRYCRNCRSGSCWVSARLARSATTNPLDERIQGYQGIGRIRGAESASYPRRALTVLQGGALSDLDNVTVRIADVAANLAVFGDRWREELGSSTFPQFVARLNIRNAEIHKAVDVIRVGDAQRYRRLIRGRPASNVQNHPNIRKLKVRRRVAVTQAQNASAEDLFVVTSRSLDVGDGEKMRDADPLSRGHLITRLPDLYAAH